jgi:multiple sugar transport system permease protein
MTATTTRGALKRVHVVSPRRRLFSGLRVGALGVLAALFLLPAYWMVTTALKPEGEAISIPIDWVPQNPTWDNFQAVLNDPSGDIIRWTVNSLITSSVQAGVHVVLCVLAAYALARLTFPGRDLWFWFIISSLMLPPVVILVPRYVMMLELDWIDTYHPLIWVHVASAFGVFLLRQFFLTIPRELEDAARMDGANTFQVIRHVIVPSSVPAIVTLAVFAFLFSWNDFLWPLFTVHGDTQTLPVGLSKFSSRFVTEYGKLMAATTLTAIPALVGFMFAQRYIVQGITLSGMKD